MRLLSSHDRFDCARLQWFLLRYGLRTVLFAHPGNFPFNVNVCALCSLWVIL